MSDKPWYHNGLRFECTQCGDCCTGAPGYVWVNNEEIGVIAESLGMEPDEFESRYVRRIGIRKSLREFSNGDCVFFDNDSRKCQVYDTRPRQCRTWPFWRSNLKNAQSWEMTCEICPGSGKGKLYQVEEIETQKSVVRV